MASEKGWRWEESESLTFIMDDETEEGITRDQLGYEPDEAINTWQGMRSFGDLTEESVDRRECWWRGTTLRAKSKTIVVGMPKAKKTFFVLGMGMAAASGASFGGESQEYTFPRPIKTFWFQGEMHDDDTFDRFRMMTSHMTRSQKQLINQNFLFSDALRWDITNDTHFKRIEYEIIKHRPELIFFDPFSKFNAVNENDNMEMLECLDRFDCLIRKHGVSIVLVHHTAKGAKAKIQNGTENPFDVMRGASSLLGWMEAGLIIGPGEDKESIKVIYEHRAQRVPEPHGMTLDIAEDGSNAQWKLLVEKLDNGNYSALKEESDGLHDDGRVEFLLCALKQSGSMTAAKMRTQLMKVYKVSERTAATIVGRLSDHPFVDVTGDTRTRLFHYKKSD